MHRVSVVVGGLLASGARVVAAALAVAVPALMPAHASAGAIRCEGESYVGPDRARYRCGVHNVRRKESVEFHRNPACDRFRDFEATASDDDILAYDTRTLPRRSFLLSSFDLGDGRRGFLRVRVYVNRKRVKIINRGDFMIDFSYSQRCKL